jgi:hypothetical protein
MGVKVPGSPLSGGSEAIEPMNQNLDELAKSTGLDAAISQLENPEGQAEVESPAKQALKQIASQANLGSPGGALAAIRESARFMIRDRLPKKFQGKSKTDKMVEDLSEYVTNDPSLQRRLLAILQNLQEE